MTDDLPSHVRGYIVGYLNVAVDEAAQHDYQARVPYVSVSNELFNQWEDLYHPDWDPFRAAFTADEAAALAEYNEALDSLAQRTPQTVPPLDEFAASPEGRELRAAAAATLARLAPRT
jgi:hypothetical protein